ncbi:hypothetical protein DXA10_10095 [Firmicutes bacterium AM55-24TS]|nr:hypothetical protein DXA10_10095 [Firmicutes bacterium AM55-24TS]
MEKEKMYELKSKAKIQLNKLKDEMMKKKKQGLSHFVEILIAILVAIVVGGVFMVLSNEGMRTIFSNMIDRIINGFQG